MSKIINYDSIKNMSGFDSFLLYDWEATSMSKNYTFEDIKNYLKKYGDDGREALEALDALADAAIIFSPVFLGPQLLPLLSTLGETKDRIMNLSKTVYDFVVKNTEPSYMDRVEKLMTAYCLISFTAYLEALSDAFPPKIRKKLKQEIQEVQETHIEPLKTSECELFYSTISDFHVDHMNSYSSVKTRLSERYKEISNNLLSVVKKACSIEQKISENDYEALENKILNLPKAAMKKYEAQCLSLATEFKDFSLLVEFKRFDEIELANMQARVLLEEIVNSNKRLDVGLNDLHTIIDSLPQYFDTIKSKEIVTDLKNKYTAIIQEPIIDDKEIKSRDERISLKYPKIVDAYIPQFYKCIKYQNNDIELEDNSIWKKLDVRKDLNAFLLKYLCSPDCIDYPLIILGQPGSGKSLLTKVLSAQMTSDSSSVIRIPLREINAGSSIDVLVEDQIKKLTNRTISYADFAKQFVKEPLTIILDGYDELLQAKGEVFSGYLEMIREFQKDQKDMKRPVRVIITSRITLINKARIPINSTILRLMEFDQEQQNTWIDIWNRTNCEYFKTTKIKGFELPTEGSEAVKSIQSLAQQPLLLLMLAIYDSEANDLAKNINIKRTELYNNLIRRFIRRERRRYVKGFEDKPLEEQECIIDEEMRRLGVVAMGMYNRQKLFIHTDQLDKDICLFDAHREHCYHETHTLKESESVLGSFFFIHKSTAQDVNEHSEKSENVYEFLHNTFGEFLAADFILKNAIKTLNNIYVDKVFKKRSAVQLDSIESEWYYCLMYVPLYSRPVVVEMLQEHVNKVLTNKNINMHLSNSLFLEYLHFLVKSHLKMVLDSNTVPQEFCQGIHFERESSLLGCLSTYSINLIILVSALSSDGYIFNEDEYMQNRNEENQDGNEDRQIKDNTLLSRPWDRLTALWKAWFSQAELIGLSVILKAQRIQSTVHIKCNKSFEATHYKQPIDISLCVSYALGDYFQAGLAGLQTTRFTEVTKMSNYDICKMLRNENLDLFVSYKIILLRRIMNFSINISDNVDEYIDNIKNINDILISIADTMLLDLINDDNMLSLLDTIKKCITHKLINIHVYYIILKAILKSKRGRSNLHYSHNENMAGFACDEFMISEMETNPLRTLSGERYGDNHYIIRKMYIENAIKQRTKENSTYDKRLYRFVRQLGEEKTTRANLEAIDILSTTNPDYLLRILITLAALNDSNDFVNEYIERFLRNCSILVNKYDIGCIECDTLVNIIKLARHHNYDQLITDIYSKLDFALQTRLDLFIYFYPKQVNDIMRLFPSTLPSLTDNNQIESSIRRALNNENRSLSPDYIVEYIKLLHTNLIKVIEPQAFSDIANLLCPKAGKIDLAKLTISQLDELLWWAIFVGDSALEKKIKTIRAFK